MKNKNYKLILIIFSFLIFLLPKEMFSQGPTAPEASSFEPVDATDMVSLLSGDFSYVQPIINIPSPEGGYSLALSYHGGIAMDQETSWVGLGWNINPGAINRSVNGYPDDWKNEKVSNFIHDAGGSSVSNDLSLTVGWGDGLYSVGVYTSWASNRSINGENSSSNGFGVQGSWVNKGGQNYNVRIGTDGVGLGIGKISLNLSSDGTFSGDFSLNQSVGIAFETGSGNGIGLTAEGHSFGNNSNSNSVVGSLSSNALNIKLNLFDVVKIKYSRTKYKYWLSQKRTSNVTGSLYAAYLDDMLNASINRDREDFDSYESQSSFVPKNSLQNNNLSYLSKDSYMVTAQGLSGNISASFNDFGTLFSKRKIIDDGDYAHDHIDTFFPKHPFTKSIEDQNLFFYFDNIYSSHLSLNTSNTWNNINNDYVYITDLYNDIDISSHNLNTSFTNDEGEVFNNYNETNKRITKGSFIEVFTNKQIKNSSALYFNDVYIDRNIANEDGIGAYIITSLDGKKYLYTIPVYQKEKFDRSGDIDNDINDSFYEEQSLTPYATHWLLTAIIGPDYIDSNNNHEIDKNDYGYWVKFDYGKWSDGYVWRTPTNDFQKSDISKKYSWGIKEIYYLDKVETRTHTAFFIKKERLDGQSNTLVQIGTSRNNPLTFTETGRGYNPKNDIFVGTDGQYYFSSTYNKFSTNDIGVGSCSIWNTDFIVTNKYFAKAHQHKLLKLDRIILIKNELIPSGFNKSSSGSNSKKVSEIYISERVKTANGCHNFDSGTEIIHDEDYFGEFNENIFDVDDLNQYNTVINDNLLKNIIFSYDYTNSINTPNSLAQNKGKLTLKSLNFKGKRNTNNLPLYKFNYFNSSFSRDYIDDWGYNKFNIKANSLKSIEDPLGAKINITYENDDYYKVASNAKRILNEGLLFHLTCNSYTSDIIFEVTNDLDNETEEIDSFLPLFTVGETTKLSLFICRKERYGGHRRKVTLDLEEVSAQVISVNTNSVTLSINGNANYWTHDDQDLGWVTNRKWSKFDVYHANGSTDGVIIRNDDVTSYTCYDWREGGYENSDVTFFYDLIASSTLLEQSGGGIRVKKIEVTDNFDIFKKEYFYNAEGYDKNKNDLNYRSSGITSYAPSKYSQFIPYQSEMPSPYVMYKNVSVKSDNIESFYTFKVLEPVVNNGDNLSMGDLLNINVSTEENLINQTNQYIPIKLSKKIYNIENNLASLGSLISITNKNNDGHIISQTENVFKIPNNNDQGVLKESFNLIKKENNDNQYINIHTNVTSKTTYVPSLDYTKKTKSGFSTINYFTKKDFNTGVNLVTETIKSDGTRTKSEIIPAYEKYNVMGSKVNNPNNKNMLSQETATFNYIWNENNQNWNIAGASINTWNNLWSYRTYDGTIETPTNNNEKIWRKHKSFVWQSEIDENGLYINFDQNSFNWGIGASQSSEWKNINTTTLYNHFSNSIETMDINENYTSVKMGDNNSKVFASANAKYSNMFYSGAEDLIEGTRWFSGEVRLQYGTSVNINQTKAHTGKYSVRAESNQVPFTVEHVGEAGKYKLSVWVHKDNYLNTIVERRNGTDNSNVNYNEMELIFAGDWVQLNFTFSLSAQQKVYILNTSGVGYYDDFRLTPIRSIMASYVYNEWGELTHIIGANNLAVMYEYDNAGKLEKVYREVADTQSITGGFKLAHIYNTNYKKNQIIGGNINATYNASLDNFDLSVYGLTGGDESNYTYNWYYQVEGDVFTYLGSGNNYLFGDVFNIFCNSSDIDKNKRFKCVISDGDSSITLVSNYENVCGNNLFGFLNFVNNPRHMDGGVAELVLHLNPNNIQSNSTLYIYFSFQLDNPPNNAHRPNVQTPFINYSYMEINASSLEDTDGDGIGDTYYYSYDSGLYNGSQCEVTENGITINYCSLCPPNNFTWLNSNVKFKCYIENENGAFGEFETAYTVIQCESH